MRTYSKTSSRRPNAIFLQTRRNRNHPTSPLCIPCSISSFVVITFAVVQAIEFSHGLDVYSGKHSRLQTWCRLFCISVSRTRTGLALMSVSVSSADLKPVVSLAEQLACSFGARLCFLTFVMHLPRPLFTSLMQHIYARKSSNQQETFFRDIWPTLVWFVSLLEAKIFSVWSLWILGPFLQPKNNNNKTTTEAKAVDIKQPNVIAVPNTAPGALQFVTTVPFHTPHDQAT